MHIAVALIFTALVLPATLPAQNTPDAYAQQVASRIRQIAQANRTDKTLWSALNLGENGTIEELATRLSNTVPKSAQLEQNFLQIGESASQSIGNGASPLSSAASSAVTKAVSSILGIAQEAGAVSSSTSGSTTTLTASIARIAQLLDANMPPCYVVSNKCSPWSAVAQGASFSASFNTSASTMPNSSGLSDAALQALTGSQHPAFSGLSFQQSFHGRKTQNITQQSFDSTLETIAKDKATATLGEISQKIRTSFRQSLPLSGDLPKPMKDCLAPLENGSVSDQDLDAPVDHCIDVLASLAASIDGMSDLLVQFARANTAYSTVREAALTTLFYKSNFSIEYDLTNNLNQPMTSTFKSIYGYQSKSGSLQTTANGSVTLYNSLQGSSESRIRSAQAAVQFDYCPATKPALQAVYSAAYYFQYMVANGLIDLPSTAFAPGTTIPLPNNASVLLNTKGPIHIGQGKITLKLKGSNVSIPLALTMASRTDLIKANRVSGNFGISYDFSSLLTPKR